MLLKLIPARQEPTIHYSVSFADLPATLPSPSSWTVQMSHLIREDLEVPATLHSLDRAAGITSLLEEVALDLGLREVRCRFIDGSVEHFAFDHKGTVSARRFANALEDIISVVAESTREDQQAASEHKRTREKQRARSMSVAATPAVPAKSFSSKVVVKHRKQRSLFMQIVYSMVSLTSPSASSFPHRSAKVPSSPTHIVSPRLSSTEEVEPSANAVCIPATPGASARARALRRAARSALVDTFRRFVLGELAARYYVGPNFRLVMGVTEGQEMDCPYLYRYQRERNGFCIWILHSMRRRALERMEQILDEAGTPTSIVSFAQRQRELDDSMLQTTTMEMPLSFSDEEDEGDEEPSVTTHEVSVGSAAETDAPDGKWTGQAKRPTPPRRTSSTTSHSSVSECSTNSSSDESHFSTSTTATSVESDTDPKSPSAAYPPRRESLLSIKEQDHPPLHHLSLTAQLEYTQLDELRTRLNGLVQFAATQARVVVEESRSRAEMLLVRSKRRAWLNKALKHPIVPSRDEVSSPYGFATPFRSSPLAMYVVSADDLARQRSAISRGSVSSTSSLSSAYFRSVSSMSSTSSSASSISKRSSVRPRIRPKIDFEAALAAAIVQLDVNDPDVPDEPLKFADVPYDNDCEFEIFDQPSEPRRHRRRRPDLPVVPAPGMQAFPVTEDHTQYNAPLRAVRGRNHRRSFEIDQGHRTFMGCDEIRVDEDSMHSEIVDKQHLELGFGYPVQMFPLPPPHVSVDELQGITEPLSPTDVGMEHMASETELGMHKPIGAGRAKLRPRTRTNSMIGAILRGAKGVQRTFGHTPKAQLQQQLKAGAVAQDDTLPATSTSSPAPESPSHGYISYAHHPPNPALSPAPKPAPRRSSDEIFSPPSSSCASGTVVYNHPEARVQAEAHIQIHVTDVDDINSCLDPSSESDDESSNPSVALSRRKSSSYPGQRKQNHPRPKLDGVFAEPDPLTAC